MNIEKMKKIFEDTAYVHTGGSPEELKTAKYLRDQLLGMGMCADIVPFQVPMSGIQEAVLLADGVSIPCKGYLCAGDGDVEAPFYYLRNTDPWSLSQCKGKIVMIDGYLKYWMYQDLCDNGALGFITYDGSMHTADRDIDQRELRSFVHNGRKIPGVNINCKDAVGLMERATETVRISLKQHEYTADSHNVILELPGETEEYIAFTAHYDSTSLSQGAYDNMSGSVGILALAEYFKDHPHRYSLRFLWCGSEERGLLGSKNYCANEENLKGCVLCINLDMIGSFMGRFISCVTGEEKLCHYVEYLASERGYGITVNQDVYSSDSTPFADKGIPAISFARLASHNTAAIHNRYDTMDILSSKQMTADIAFITAFADRMANAQRCPVAKIIPDNIKDKLNIYLNRKRP